MLKCVPLNSCREEPGKIQFIHFRAVQKTKAPTLSSSLNIDSTKSLAVEEYLSKAAFSSGLSSTLFQFLLAMFKSSLVLFACSTS